MTVRELIEQLQLLNPDAEVETSMEYPNYHVRSVRDYGDVVTLSDENP